MRMYSYHSGSLVLPFLGDACHDGAGRTSRVDPEVASYTSDECLGSEAIVASL